MEADLLAEMVAIKWIAIASLVLLLLYLVVMAGFLHIVSKALKEVWSDRDSNSFNLIADGHLSRGETDELIEYALEKLETYSHSPDIHWYLAKAYFQKEDWVESKKCFLRSADISPVYREAIEPYIEEIEHRLEKHQPEIIK
jgi:tetratricopeptide (TPR) repeat protein